MSSPRYVQGLLGSRTCSGGRLNFRDVTVGSTGHAADPLTAVAAPRFPGLHMRPRGIERHLSHMKTVKAGLVFAVWKVSSPPPAFLDPRQGHRANLKCRTKQVHARMRVTSSAMIWNRTQLITYPRKHVELQPTIVLIRRDRCRNALHYPPRFPASKRTRSSLLPSRFDLAPPTAPTVLGSLSRVEATRHKKAMIQIKARRVPVVICSHHV